ncbi:MAG TPA: hypothetical protein VHL77_07810, partial [Ferruginibacter sp.]|nr:hypothetical protein [Ferruginibacter sp.]
MQLLQKLLNKLNGLHYSQEYLCFGNGTLEQTLQVYLVDGNRIIKDLTGSHLFVGYNPLIFAFAASAQLSPSIKIIFTQRAMQLNDVFRAKDAIASLDMQLIKEQSMQEVLFYKGIQGTHHFLTGFQQAVMSMYNERYNKKPGNVFLHHNLYKQVQIAYAVPRNISLITVGNAGLFNLF